MALLERGLLALPDGVKLEDFVAAGGKVPVVSARPETVTARQLFDRYLEVHSNGAVEGSTLSTLRTHFNNVVRSVGQRVRVQSLTADDLQKYIDRSRKRNVSAVTLKKELASVRACWNWAVQTGLLTGNFPGRGPRFPKEAEKAPFRTFAEIQAMAGDPELWESLSLTRPEVEELLEYVRQRQTLPWVYAMAAFAAYTGARRSELLRSLVSDVDLPGGIVTIREKKRFRGKISNRTAPLTSKLAAVLRDWLAVKPASPFLFCQSSRVLRSKTMREPPVVTKDEAHDHFKRTLAGGKSEQQRKRYRHLYPGVMKAAISRVFG